MHATLVFLGINGLHREYEVQEFSCAVELAAKNAFPSVNCGKSHLALISVESV